jgi:AgrD protein
MRKQTKGIMAVLAAVLTLVATSVASAACLWTFYQPEEPKCLREE